MKSKTVDIWEQTVQNPPKDYQGYFIAEKKFLKNNISRESIILDVGSGSGRTIKELASLVKKFIGIDNDPEAIKLSKETLKDIKNAEVYLEDVEKTHFNNKTFDIVFIGLTFCNFGESKFRVLSEIKRILKDNGKFIFSVFNENALPSREEAYKYYEGGYTIIDKEKGLVKFNKNNAISEQFSENEIKDILDKTDFEVLNLEKGKIYYILSCRKKGEVA